MSFSKQYLSGRLPIKFTKPIKIYSSCAVGGTKEKAGPLGSYLDIFCDDEKNGQKTWEKAESEMCRMALDVAMSKGDLRQENIDFLIGGDLLNQCVGAGYGLSAFDIPYFGIYGACSSFAEAVILGSLMIESGAAESVACVVSSHFCSAERQFRYPLEYGSFAEATAQNTVTGAGCVILGHAQIGEEGIFVTEALPGIVTDSGIRDASNMGAAMCTAASDTIVRYFEAEKAKAEDFDLVVSGDLGKEGKSIALEQMKEKVRGIENVYSDCGIMIYDLENQDVGCGGSGCGCSALVTTGYIYNNMLKRKLKNCIVVGTGAMMSPQSLLQGQSIPAIGHLIRLEAK